jgi:predicted nucleic acid-binding protein
MFLIDTNVISELRKGHRANPHVTAWLGRQNDDQLFLSVLVVGELRRGIERIARRDKAAAMALEAWLNRVVHAHEDRILPVNLEVAQAWGRLNVPDPLPVMDSLLAATAHVHGLTVVTRNSADFQRTGVPTLNPFLKASPVLPP